MVPGGQLAWEELEWARKAWEGSPATPTFFEQTQIS